VPPRIAHPHSTRPNSTTMDQIQEAIEDIKSRADGASFSYRRVATSRPLDVVPDIYSEGCLHVPNVPKHAFTLLTRASTITRGLQSLVALGEAKGQAVSLTLPALLQLVDAVDGGPCDGSMREAHAVCRLWV
jgi:hypothetical protein